VDRGRSVVAELGEIACPTDRLELTGTLQSLGHRDHVDGLAVLEEFQHGPKDAPMSLTVKVFGVQKIRDLDDRVTVDEDRTEHGLLGVKVLGRQSVYHVGPALTFSGGSRCDAMVARRTLRPSTNPR
jgi:hypothetical protein